MPGTDVDRSNVGKPTAHGARVAGQQPDEARQVEEAPSSSLRLLFSVLGSTNMPTLSPPTWMGGRLVR